MWWTEEDVKIIWCLIPTRRVQVLSFSSGRLQAGFNFWFFLRISEVIYLSAQSLTPIRELWTKNPQLHLNSYLNFWISQIGVKAREKSFSFAISSLVTQTVVSKCTLRKKSNERGILTSQHKFVISNWMVENQRNLCRFTFILSATPSPSKINNERWKIKL